MLVTLTLSGWAGLGNGSVIVAVSMGASSVLLFAAPHGRFSQPWPVVGGHGLAALAGVTCAAWIADSRLAAACAVGLTIALQLLFRCLHPPGGGTALGAVIGGAAVKSLGAAYVFSPVLANALTLVGLAVVINYPFPWRRYPAAIAQLPPSPSPSPSPDDGPTHAEVEQVLRSFDSFVDISEEELVRITTALARLRRR